MKEEKAGKKMEEKEMNIKMKRMIAAGLAAVLALTALTGCGDDSEKGGGSEGGADMSAREISVLSREDGSGTRGAFIELFGIEEKDADGNKVDNTTLTAEITNSTSVMMTTVAGNEAAIGYISLGSLDNSVKALKIDGAEASAENVKNGSYKAARPFNVVYKEDQLSELGNDFLSFIMSDEGQAVIEENGYVSQGSEGAYKGTGVSGTITVSGSSSVTPVMEKLKEAYASVNPEAKIEVQQNDSSTGIADTISGMCDIGMASRELKEEEASQGITPLVIAMDGIAVIVNKSNTAENLSSEQIKAIFTGETTVWGDLSA